MKVDVAIIGGGPAGSTAGSVLKKYAPGLKVAIFEREKFPREHVGESQLPPISQILAEIGAWDKVEAAGFPIKIGATYRWGQTDDLWDFEFFPASQFQDEPRPAKFEGQRTRTAFQVDRAVYDKILLDHSAEMGCEVFEETRVLDIVSCGDRVDSIRLEDGTKVKARWVIDCSGGSGIVRRAMKVEVDEPSSLRNVAFWDYWDDAQWSITIGKGGTRVLVLSLGYGWIWFIPVSESRASVGLVIPAEYYKQAGMKPQDIYAKALADEPLLKSLIKDAKNVGPVQSTKDWSFISKRMSGENWFLAGESAGFADPILAAGMTLAQVGAREAAYTILALEGHEHDAKWLKSQFDEGQTRRLLQHIRFADFWYSANGCFTDLKAFTAEIAKDAGLTLDPNAAFQWLGTGGFIKESTGAGMAGIPLGAIKDVVETILPGDAELKVTQYTHLHLNLEGAVEEEFAQYVNGKVHAIRRMSRGEKTLPEAGLFYVLRQIIAAGTSMEFIVNNMVDAIIKRGIARTRAGAMEYGMAFLETMVRDGWVTGEVQEHGVKLDYQLPKFASTVHVNRDLELTP